MPGYRAHLEIRNTRRRLCMRHTSVGRRNLNENFTYTGGGIWGHNALQKSLDARGCTNCCAMEPVLLMRPLHFSTPPVCLNPPPNLCEMKHYRKGALLSLRFACSLPHHPRMRGHHSDAHFEIGPAEMKPQLKVSVPQLVPLSPRPASPTSGHRLQLWNY